MIIDRKNVTIIGLGLIGVSILKAFNYYLRNKFYIKVYDNYSEHLKIVKSFNIADEICNSVEESVKESDLVILAIPVGVMAEVGKLISPYLKKGAILTDTGSTKLSVIRDLSSLIPKDVFLVPSHPLAGTEHSGPKAGFHNLFEDRFWIIISKENDKNGKYLENLFKKFGSKVEFMDEFYHDKVLAITSHLPHLIAYSIVDTANNLESDLKNDVIRYSATGFRDFTRLASSDPIMWRDVFLNNTEAVLEMLQRFNEDLSVLQKLIRKKDSNELYNFFKNSKKIRNKIIKAKQHLPELSKLK